jgi:gliding motility associated protien GldN
MKNSMNSAFSKFFLAAAFVGSLNAASAQVQPTMQIVDASSQESSTQQQTELQSLPWFQEITGQRTPLNYEYVREADVFWKKEVWRVIDCREKMNLPFKYPKRPFIEILIDGIESGEIMAFGANDDEFKTQISAEDALALTGSSTDTIYVPDAGNPDILIPTVVTQDFNMETVNRFRIKEVWYFNKQTSTMQVRIMGIAPIMDDFDEWGNYRGPKPLFWVYMPSMRNVLVQNEAFNPFPDGVRLTWDDIFAMRLFASVVYKEDNVRDDRIRDVYESPIDQLYQSERIKQRIFNFEHDLWEY